MPDMKSAKKPTSISEARPFQFARFIQMTELESP